MTIAADDLQQIVDDVLTSVAGGLGAGAEPPRADRARADVVAGIHISGAWNGSVLVTCSTTFAHATAAAMLDVPVGELSEDDLSDAIGEIANMIGGSVKAVLPEPSVLSLPMVTYDARQAQVPGTELVQGLDLAPLGHQLQVSVLQRQPRD